MPTLEIIGIPQSTYVRAVRMACEEKGVPYTLVPEPPHSAAVTALHPFGKIPVMRNGDLELCESKAIATYIDRTHPGPRLIPDDPKLAAEVEKWVSIVNTTIDPVIIREYALAFILAKDGKPDAARVSAAVANGYLVGDSFTFADINLMPILFYLGRFPEGAALLEGTTNLKAYFARHAARESFKNTMPPMAKN